MLPDVENVPDDDKWLNKDGDVENILSLLEAVDEDEEADDVGIGMFGEEFDENAGSILLSLMMVSLLVLLLLKL